MPQQNDIMITLYRNALIPRQCADSHEDHKIILKSTIPILLSYSIVIVSLMVCELQMDSYVC